MARAMPVVVLLAVLTAGCGLSVAVPDPDTPTSCAEPCASPPTELSGPATVSPRPGMVDVHPVPFESATPQGDDVRVVWWSGVEPCHVLDHVDVDETVEKLTITLHEGRDPEAGDVACIEMAVQKATLVTPAAPVGEREIVDGARRGDTHP